MSSTTIGPTYEGLCFHALVTAVPDDERELAISGSWRTEMRAARTARRISQASLGRRVGVSQNVISQIESGDIGSSSAVLPICRVLGLQPPMFFQHQDDERWVRLGRMLREQDESMFRSMLSMLESAVGALGHRRR